MCRAPCATIWLRDSRFCVFYFYFFFVFGARQNTFLRQAITYFCRKLETMLWYVVVSVTTLVSVFSATATAKVLQTTHITFASHARKVLSDCRRRRRFRRLRRHAGKATSGLWNVHCQLTGATATWAWHFSTQISALSSMQQPYKLISFGRVWLRTTFSTTIFSLESSFLFLLVRSLHRSHFYRCVCSTFVRGIVN